MLSWHYMSRRIWALLLFALIALSFTWRGFLPGHVLLPLDLVAEFGLWKLDPDQRRPVWNRSLSDVTTQFVPWDTEIRRHLSRGDMPWVDRYAGDGMPLFANPQTALFSPFTWPRLLWGERGWAFCVFLRLACAGLGAYFLTRTMGANHQASCLSGFVYLASAYSIVWAMHPLANVTACLPWLAAAALQLARRPAPGAMVLTILAAVGATAGGHPESLAMAVLAIAAMMLWHTPRSGYRRLGWSTAAAATGFLMLASVTVPFLLLMVDSEAAHWRGDATAHEFRTVAAAAQILPGSLGGPLAGEIDLSRMAASEAGYQMRNGAFLGGVVLLALILVGHQLPPAFRRGLMVGWVALVLSWCPPLVEVLVGKLPIFNLTLPTYRAVGFVLFGAVAAGPALMLVAARPRPRLAAVVAALGGSLLILGAAPSVPAARPVAESTALAGLEALHDRGLLPRPLAIYEQRLPIYLDLAAATTRRRLAMPGAAWLLAGIALACDQPVDLYSLPQFRREAFPSSGPLPWLDRPDAAEQVDQRLERGDLTEQESQWCRHWIEHGYLHLEGFHDLDAINRAWSAVDEAVRSGVIPVSPDLMTEGGDYEGRFQNLHQHVPELAAILRHQPTVDLIALLLDRAIHPFQTIAFYLGSEQAEHSDSVHMATYPEGYLVGAWTAAEDIHPDSGPLVYYPGSHRLPYYLGAEVGISPRQALIDFYGGYHNLYEPFIQDLIRRSNLERVEHTPKQGDLLLWHANLLHGGSPRRDPEPSRRSIVCHYFARDAICYHDLSASLAPLD